jgi:hypothetical protein
MSYTQQFTQSHNQASLKLAGVRFAEKFSKKKAKKWLNIKPQVIKNFVTLANDSTSWSRITGELYEG